MMHLHGLQWWLFLLRPFATFKERINRCHSSLHSEPIFVYVGNGLRSTVEQPFSKWSWSEFFCQPYRLSMPLSPLAQTLHPPDNTTISGPTVSYSYALLDWMPGVGIMVTAVLEKSSKKSGITMMETRHHTFVQIHTQHQDWTILSTMDFR